jgi:hypothetical protein
MKLKPITAFLVLAFAALMVLWAGCASTSAYHGPDYSSPIVRDEPYTHWNTLDMRAPHWETHHVLVFENPLYKPVSFDVDCQYNRFAVDVPARTVQRLLLVREDGSCDIHRVPDRTF